MKAAQIEDSYRLCPLQQGMLFNSLYAPDSGVNIVQVVCALHEDLQVAAFEQAWQDSVARHPILRTAARWEGLAEPVQDVYRHVRLPLQQLDGRDLPQPARQAWLEDYLRADRLLGFTLTEAPLIRVALLRFAEADYRFVLTFHHIALDGRSLLLLLKEVLGVYEALRLGQAPACAPPRPYRDYITWLEQQDFSGDETFWRQLLQGFTAPTPLAGSGSPGAPTGYASQEITLPEAATATLLQFAKQHQLTLNTLVQAAWALLLSRYSGQADVVFGATRSCRRSTVEGVEAMVGLFINTLPVRVRARPEAPLLPWLKELRAQGMAVRSHQHTSLMQVQQWSDVPKGMPLFESIVVFENFLLHSHLRGQGGPWEQREFELRRQPNYPLSLCIFAEQELLVKIVYDQQRFDQASIGRMLGHFTTLLVGIADAPDCHLSALPLVTEAERAQLLGAWNDTSAAYPRDTCVQHLFEAQAARTPDAIALVAGERQVTYQWLNGQANRLAHHLRGLGVGPEVPVGICLERSPELIIAQLGVLKADGAYISLDPAAPPERLRYMLGDAGVPVLLTSQEQRTKPVLSEVEGNKEQSTDKITDRKGVLHTPPADHVEAPSATPPAPPGQPIVIDLHAEWARMAQEPAENLDGGATADHLAYVIYTSGSTGRPKGVQIAHAGLTNLAAWHQCAYQVTSADRTMQIASPAFDASVWEIWPYLTAGASLHLPDEDTRSAPARLAGWLRDHAITIGFLPTALAEAVLSQPWPGGAALRALLVGGDQLHQAPPTGLPFKLYNHYGPTENTVVATAAHIAAGTSDTRVPPIGRPIANVQVYLLGARIEPVPIGVAGELYIGGAGVARGYLGRPDLTAERFVPNPFDQERLEIGDWRLGGETPISDLQSPISSRLYRTGDLCRYREDGNLEFLGRIDGQVKIRGFRIELGEIEAALAQHPTVREAIVLAREDTPGEKRLIAYVVPGQEQRTKNKEQNAETLNSQFSILNSQFSGELRDFLKQKLPDYMVPAAVVPLEAFPLTASGKVDRRALAELHQEWPAQERRYVAPRTPIEELLAGIWTEVLGVGPGRPPIGAYDNFFELGGHSLLATQVIFRVYEVLGVEPPLRSLFEAATVAEFAAVVQRAQDSGAALQSPGIAPLDRSRHRMRVS